MTTGMTLKKELARFIAEGDRWGKRSAPQAEQVWRRLGGWSAIGWAVEWDELWLLLGNPHPNVDAHDAFNLETGEFSTVFPTHAPYEWERVE